MLAAVDVWAQRTAPAPPKNDPVVLARVEVSGDVRDYKLAAHAFLQDSAAREYLLVFATENELRRARWPYRVLESPAAPPEDYLIAVRMSNRFTGIEGAPLVVLQDDGISLTLRAGTTGAEALSERGFALQRLTREPVDWPKSPVRRSNRGIPSHPESVARHVPFIESMLSQVRSNQLYWLMRRFTGEEVIYADGQPGIITTRHTASGAPVARALQFAYERLRALGSNVTFQGWSLSGTTNRNLVATQIGTIRSNEWILITAHLDNMPAGARAPGADDDASGSLGVLTAAAVFSQYRFDRSIRFMLFTGEEQGLYGSTVQAGLAFTNGDNITGVINADMIAWDGNAVPVFRAFTRTVSNPGFTNDLALAVTVTNIINDYGLGSDLVPVITTTGLTASDHAPFWNRGYPAILLSEDYNLDFNPYYHTAADSIIRVNWKYYVATVRTLLGTVAHLAEPVATAPFDLMRLTVGNWQTNSGVGGGAWLAKILPATTAGPDAQSVAWAGATVPLLPAWLKPFTVVQGTALQTDVRYDATEVRFPVKLAVVTTNGSSLSTSNRLQFDFLAPPRPDRIYLAKATTDPVFTFPSPGFLSVTNLRDLTAAGGQMTLPNLNVATNDATYGQFELVVRELNTNRSACQVWLDTINGSTVTLATSAQVGASFLDQVDAATVLDGGSWQVVGSYTNLIKPDYDNFDSGWQDVSYEINTLGLPVSDHRFFRIRRTWLAQ